MKKGQMEKSKKEEKKNRRRARNTTSNSYTKLTRYTVDENYQQQ